MDTMEGEFKPVANDNVDTSIPLMVLDLTMENGGHWNKQKL